MKKIIPVILLLSGCGIVKMPKQAETPSVVISEAGGVRLDGDAKQPAKVDTKNSDASFTIPEGSRFEFNEKLGTMTLVLSKATQMTVNRKETHVEGPKSFDPPKQPTIQDQAEAKADFWTVLGLRTCLAIGMGAALFGLVKDWNLVMYGGIALSGAGLFGLFVQRHPLLLALVGLGIALMVVGPTLWHTILKKVPNKEPNAKRNKPS